MKQSIQVRRGVSRTTDRGMMMDPMFVSRPMAVNRQNNNGILQIFKALFCCQSDKREREGVFVEREPAEDISVIEPDMQWWYPERSSRRRHSKLFSRKNFIALLCFMVALSFLAMGTGMYFGSIAFSKQAVGEDFLEENIDNIIKEEIARDLSAIATQKIVVKSLSGRVIWAYFLAEKSILDSKTEGAKEIADYEPEQENNKRTARDVNKAERYTGNNTDLISDEIVFEDDKKNKKQIVKRCANTEEEEYPAGESNKSAIKTRKRGNLNDQEYPSIQDEELNFNISSELAKENSFKKKRFVDFQEKYKHLLPNNQKIHDMENGRE